MVIDWPLVSFVTHSTLLLTVSKNAMWLPAPPPVTFAAVSDLPAAVVSVRLLPDAAMVKSDTAANVTGGGAGNHIAFLDTVNSKVLWVTNETSGQSITIGNPVSFPSLVYTVNQPT